MTRHKKPSKLRYKKKLKPFIVITSVAVVGVLSVLFINAAANTYSFEAESGSVTGQASTITDAAASGGSAVKFGTAQTTLYGWQKTASNTGLASVGMNCDSLPAYSGTLPIPAGSRITGVRFTGQIWLYKGNIVIDKSCFKPTPGSMGYGLPLVSSVNVTGPQPAANTPSDVFITNSEFDGTLLDDKTAALATCTHGIINLTNNYCHHFGSGIALYDTDYFLSVTIESNYVTDMVGWGDGSADGNHSDGFTIRDFSLDTTPTRQAIFRNNRIDTKSPNTTGSFFIQDTWSSGVGNVYISGNLLEGLGWEMGIEKRNAPMTNIHATNNRFGGPADGGFGTCYKAGGFVWTEWAQNFINDPTKADNKGAVVDC